MKLFGFWAILLFTTSLLADTQMQVSNSSFLGLGLSAQSLSATAVSASAVSPTIDYRLAFDHPDWTMKGIVTPLLNTSLSLVGLETFIGGGYKVWGRSVKKVNLSDDSDSILSYQSKATKWLGYIDLGLAVTPVFGTNNTSTYSGPQIGFSLYQLSKFPLEYSLTFSKQSSGSNELNVLGISVLYVTQFK